MSLGARVVVVGDVMTDVVVRPAGPLRHGSDVEAAIRILPGGSGANQAAWIAALGGRATLLARVGAADRDAHAAALRVHGVMPLLAADPEHPSGVLVALIAADGERSFLTDRGAGVHLTRADLPDAALDGARLLHVSGYALFAPGPREAVLDYAAVATARGIPWTVDAASAGPLTDAGAGAFLSWTRGAETLFANAAEAAALTGTDDPASQLTALSAHYDCVVLKRGAKGAMAVERGGLPVTVPAAEAVPLDTTGAGDAFLAGFVLARLRGAPLGACLEAGTATAAQAVTQPGGRPVAAGTTPMLAQPQS